MTTFSGITSSEMLALKASEDEQNLTSPLLNFAPTFAKVPDELFAERLPRRISDQTETAANADVQSKPSCAGSVPLAPNLSFQPVSTAVPTSLSMDDVSLQLTAFNLSPQRPPQSRSPRATLVDTPSIVDGALLSRRIAQLDVVMRELEDSKDFWNRAELLLQDSWLNGYKGTFLEQNEQLGAAADSYKRALKLYALALKLDRLTAKSSHHIISFYFLLRRYANVLTDPRLPKEMKDDKTVNQIREQMAIIRIEREKWGMSNPETEDEPFAYAGTVLKVLCV